jgi:hypothetical protein
MPCAVSGPTPGGWKRMRNSTKELLKRYVVTIERPSQRRKKESAEAKRK